MTDRGRSTTRRSAMTRFSIAATLFAGCANAPGDSHSSEPGPKPNPHLWRPRTKSVAVFKNGFGFFTREAEVTLRDGWCVAERVPPATFGTFAVYALDQDRIVDVVGAGPGEVVEFDGRDALAAVSTKRARLQIALHLDVELRYSHKGRQRTATGRIASVGPEFAILECAERILAVPIAGISRMQLLNMPLRVHVRAEPPAAVQRTRLGMAYLRKGITWIPEYTLRILDDQTAELTLRGTLVNEAEDLLHSDVHFVVGVPSFLHTDYLAPISVGQIIRTIGAAVAPPAVATQIMNRAAIAYDRRAAAPPPKTRAVDRTVNHDGGDVTALLGNLPQMGGHAATDYTVYTHNDMTLRRGEKAIVTLFVKRIRYTHRYQWRTDGGMKHVLLLHNDTDTAWTTGPCLVVSDDRPLSEDLFKYTPKGGQGEMPVGTAINIAHRRADFETERKLKAHSPSSNVYLDLVNLRGELRLRNFESVSVDIVVEAPVRGKPLSASDEGRVFADVSNLKLTGRSGTVRWRLQLAPGASKVLTFRYERFVPSR